MKIRLVACGAGLLAALAGHPCWAANSEIYTKPGATSEAVAQALRECGRDTRALDSSTVVNVNMQEIGAGGQFGPPSASTAVGGAIGGAIVQALIDNAYRKAALPGCMRARGFAKTQLSDEQQKTYRSLNDDAARAQWQDAFRADMTSEDYVEALKPKATPLPSARDEPFVVGLVRFNVDRVKVSSSPIYAGGAILVTDGHYRQTAKVKYRTLLATLSALGRSYPLVVKADAIYIQTYEGRPGALGPWEDKTVWCGPVEMRGKPGTMCFRSTFEGYQFQPTEPDWFPQIGPVLELNKPLTPASLVLDELPVDLSAPPPFEVSLRVDRISKKAVELSAVARRDKTQIPFWKGATLFDGSGRAVLPFWTSRLIMTREGKGISVVLQEGGDGTGW